MVTDVAALAGSNTSPVLRGCYSHHFAENGCEMTLTGEAEQKGDFRHGMAATGEQLPAFPNSFLSNVLVRRGPKPGFKSRNEIGRCHSNHIGKAL
jgi:hypothetical protein